MPVTESGSCKQNIIYIMALILILEQKQMNKPLQGKSFNGICGSRERTGNSLSYLIMHMHLKHKEVFMKLYRHQQSSR